MGEGDSWSIGSIGGGKMVEERLKLVFCHIAEGLCLLDNRENREGCG